MFTWKCICGVDANWFQIPAHRLRVYGYDVHQKVVAALYQSRYQTGENPFHPGSGGKIPSVVFDVNPCALSDPPVEGSRGARSLSLSHGWNSNGSQTTLLPISGVYPRGLPSVVIDKEHPAVVIPGFLPASGQRQLRALPAFTAAYPRHSVGTPLPFSQKLSFTALQAPCVRVQPQKTS